jgi:hypothetical protein
VAELRRVELQHFDEGEALQQQAQERADREAASGDAAFVELYTTSRGLFGPAWPVAMPGAITAAPSKAEGAVA